MRSHASGLTGAEIQRIVHAYIGVSGGYLNGFGYSSVAEFFAFYADVEVDPRDTEGTTRIRFLSVLQHASPQDQAKILRGLLEKVPEPTAEGGRVMSVDEVRRLIDRLEGLPVPAVRPATTREVVDRALADAETLLREQGPVSAVDRVHTALHGHLRALCDSAGIPYERETTAQRLLRLLARGHPQLQVRDSRFDVSMILNAMGTMVETVNAARDNRSVAHPNEVLIGNAEAMLVINAVRTIMHYLNEKIQ